METTQLVIPVLVTGIQSDELQESAALDCRNKPGNDELWIVSSSVDGNIKTRKKLIVVNMIEDD